MPKKIDTEEFIRTVVVVPNVVSLGKKEIQAVLDIIPKNFLRRNPK